MPKKEGTAVKAAFSPCLEITGESYFDFEEAKQILRDSKFAGYAGYHYKCEDEAGNLKKPHVQIMFRFEKKTSAKQVLEGLPEGFIANGYLQRIKNWNGELRYLVHRDNPEKAQYEVKDVFTFGNIENYSSAFAKTCAASKVPFRMFLFLALHSKIRNYAEFAAVIEDRHPSWIESFSTLTPGQIASIKCILEQKYKIELPFVQSADYVEFAPESAAEEEKIAAFMAMCKMYE